MKKIFTALVTVSEVDKIEEVLNTLQIGFNDWDKSKTFELYGHELINYTIVCEEDKFTTIVEQLNGTRVY